LKSSYKITEPQTIKEFEAYFLLRYQVLRQPWNQPEGSEKDNEEDRCIHAMACDENKNVMGIARLQYNSDNEAQLRYMGVSLAAQGLGVGRSIIEYMEQKAKSEGRKIMILHARENAIPFYEKCGYTIREKSYLMWETIQHYLMEKKL
jgi:GNAT superfamily N-acetyltransferase